MNTLPARRLALAGLLASSLALSACFHADDDTAEQELARPTVVASLGASVTGTEGISLGIAPGAQGLGQAAVDMLNGWGPGRFDIRALPGNDVTRQALLDLQTWMQPIASPAHTAACFHDGSAATLGEVIDRLEASLTSVPSLSDPQKADLVEYLKSL